MQKINYSIILIFIFFLSSCDQLERNTVRLGGDIHNDYDQIRYKISNFIYEKDAFSPYYKGSIGNIGSGYCYKVMMDINCYKNPQPNLQGNLIGKQGIKNQNLSKKMPKKIKNLAPKSL